MPLPLISAIEPSALNSSMVTSAPSVPALALAVAVPAVPRRSAAEAPTNGDVELREAWDV